MKLRQAASAAHSYKRKLLIGVLAPATLALLFFIMSNLYLLHNIQQQLLTQCLQGQKVFTSAYEEEFYSLHQNSMLLLDNADIKEIYLNHDFLSPEENYKLRNIVNTLTTFNATKPYLIKSGFINETNNRFICSSYTAFLEDFYDNKYYGFVINQSDYLAHYTKRTATYQVQPLDMVGPTYSPEAIPLLQYTIGNYHLPSPLILYISKNNFSQGLQNYRLTKNSQLFIYCPATNQIIGSTDASLEQELSSVIPNLDIPEGEAPLLQTVILNGQPYSCLLSVSQTNFVDPLIFISLVPQQDILSSLIPVSVLSMASLLTCAVIAAFLGYRLSFRLYHPIQGLMQIVGGSPAHASSPDMQDSEDEMHYLNRHISTLQNSNSSLRTNMDSALPMLYNQYIVNILEQREYNNKNLESLISSYPVPFSYPYFTCAILVMRLTPRFYSDFTPQDQITILQKFSNVLELTQDTQCVKYVFLSASNKYCIISNSPLADQTEILRRDFENLLSLFTADREYIQFYIACGNTCESMQELPQSWKQANTALSFFSAFGEEHLHFYHGKPAKKDSFSMDTGEYNRLMQALMQKNEEVMNELVSNVIIRNQENELSERSFKDLYVHLYELGEQVMRQEKLSSSVLLGDHYMGLSVFVHDLTNLERSEYILLFYRSLCQRPGSEQPSSFDMEEIKAYVDAHYLEDLYLESLAEQFHTSPKYVSRVLKNALGMPFKQYLNITRIARAKELLVETDKKVDEIMEMSGFHSRNSFIRAFKLLTGVSPSEYRSLYRK